MGNKKEKIIKKDGENGENKNKITGRRRGEKRPKIEKLKGKMSRKERGVREGKGHDMIGKERG